VDFFLSQAVKTTKPKLHCVEYFGAETSVETKVSANNHAVTISMQELIKKSAEYTAYNKVLVLGRVLLGSTISTKTEFG